MKKYTHVYIDESGETGKSSRYIVFAILATDADRALEKIVKKVWKAKPQLHRLGELHAYNADDSTRRRVLLTLNGANIDMYYSVIDKSALKISKQDAYYDELARLVLKFKKSQIIIIDKKDTDKKRSFIIKKLGLTNTFEKAVFMESHKVKQLQAVDFVAWAIGRQYEQTDSSFSALINKKEI